MDLLAPPPLSPVGNPSLPFGLAPAPVLSLISHQTMWPLFLARKQLFPPGKFPTFAFMSILGVALGITALLVVQTVMFSFGEEHRKRVRENAGDVFVVADGKCPFDGASRLEALLAAQPGVEATSAYIDGEVMLLLDHKKFDFRRVRGIDPVQESKVTPFANYLRGKKKIHTEAEAKKVLDDFDDERVILGSSLADRLNVGVGDRITLVSTVKGLKLFEDGGKKIPLPREFEVCGILHSGFKLVDENTVLVTLATARELFEFPKDGADTVHLKLRDYREAEAFANQLNKGLLRYPFFARPWMHVNAHFLESVEMEKEMLFFLMFIIILVASFSIGSTLFNHVTRRVREIGLIGALGGRPVRILSLFLAQGLLVGAIGYAFGVGLTFLILHFRGEIVHLMGAQENLLQQYLFDKVPLYYNPADFVKAAILTLVLMTAVSLLPALWAARRKPSEAMRDVA